eukprot:s178_g6.t1
MCHPDKLRKKKRLAQDRSQHKGIESFRSALFRGSTVRDRLVERLERQFAMRSSEGKMVRPRDLYMAVKQSRDHKSTQLSAILRMEDMEDVVLELKRIHQKVIDKVRKPMKVTSQYPSISWRQFMDCILLEDLTKHTQGPTPCTQNCQ